MSVRRFPALLLLAGLLAILGAALAAPAVAATKKAKVFFTRDERLQTVQRPVPEGATPVDAAVRALLVGPNANERADGIGTAIPRGVQVQEIVVSHGIAFIRLPETFAGGGTGDQIDLRLAQLAYTVTSAADVGAVRILLADEPVPAPGEDPGAIITLSSLRKREIIGPVPVGIREVQRRLAQLKYLPAGYVSGRLDYRTSQALVAFQAWEGLSRTGDANLDTRRRLNKATIPKARQLTQSRRMEVSRFKGVLLLIEKGKVQRAIHVSTGAGGRTPRGTFSIYRKELRSWSRPFSVWLPYASYFSGGFAFHEYPSVPSYSASHGCIRVGYPEAPLVYKFAGFGTLVSIV